MDLFTQNPEPHLGILGLVGAGLSAIASIPGARAAAGGALSTIGRAVGLGRVAPGTTAVIAGTGAAGGYALSHNLSPAAPAVAPGVQTQLAKEGMLPLTVAGEVVPRMRCPRGYVSVEYMGAKVCMLKGCAKDLGLWKPRRKPPISVKDWRCYTRANAVQKKLERIGKTAGMVRGKRR